jgi:prepilin-type N-terminal cleavage/methylation domain-containing protein
MHTLRRRQSAFTLIEVLIAMAIFAIGSLGVLAMVTTTLHLNMNSRQMTEATQLGIRQLERLQTLPGTDTEITGCATRCYLQPALTETTSTPPPTVRPSDILGGTAGSNLYYEVTWRVASGASPRYVEVTVYWPKNRDLGSSPTWTTSLTCPGACYQTQFFSYR